MFDCVDTKVLVKPRDFVFDMLSDTVLVCCWLRVFKAVIVFEIAAVLVLLGVRVILSVKDPV